MVDTTQAPSLLEIDLKGNVKVSVVFEPDTPISDTVSELEAKIRVLFDKGAFGKKVVDQIHIPAHYAVVEAKLAKDSEALETQPGEKVDSAVPARLDRSIWDIVYVDGTTRQFSSESDAFLP